MRSRTYISNKLEQETFPYSTKTINRENLVKFKGVRMIKPKLRFPEFSGEWKEKKFGNFCSIDMGQSPSSKNYTENPNDTILIQGNADLENGKVVPRIFTKEITKTSEPGNIIMTVRAPVGDIAINNYFACIGRGVCSIKGNIFVYYLLENLKERNVWKKLSQGSTFEAINSLDIKNLNVNIPELNEQKKIASFLSQIDRKIVLLETNFC
jgi:type I restriction enzyme S subunit